MTHASKPIQHTRHHAYDRFKVLPTVAHSSHSTPKHVNLPINLTKCNQDASTVVCRAGGGVSASCSHASRWHLAERCSHPLARKTLLELLRSPIVAASKQSLIVIVFRCKSAFFMLAVWLFAKTKTRTCSRRQGADFLGALVLAHTGVLHSHRLKSPSLTFPSYSGIFLRVHIYAGRII